MNNNDADTIAAGGNHCLVGKMSADLTAKKGMLAVAKNTAVYQYGLQDISQNAMRKRWQSSVS